MDPVTQKQPEGPADLAPAVGATVRAAQAELARAVQIANLTGDPLRHVLESLSVFIAALHRLLVDGNLTIAETMRQPIDQVAIVDRLGKEAARVMNAHAEQFVYQVKRRTLVLGAGVLLATATVCGGVGYWRGYASGWSDVSTVDETVRTAFRDNPADAKLWADLIRWNPIGSEMANCRPVYAGDNRRSACSVLMWTGPAPAP